MISYFAHGYL